MKKTLYSRNLRIVLLFASILCFACGFLAIIFTNAFKENAIYADDAATVKLVLPSSKIEYLDFTEDIPVDAVKFDNGMAIITNNTSLGRSLWIYSATDNAYNKITAFDSPQTVKLLNNTTLIVQNSSSLYKIDTKNLYATPTILDSNISAFYFDVSSNYLAVRTSTTAISVYKNFVYGSPRVYNDVKPDTKFCINEKGLLFYITTEGSTSNLVCADTNVTGEPARTILESVSFSNMIADNDFLYYITGVDGKVGKISLSNNDDADLTATSEFELGNINFSSSISFYNGKLIITDSTLTGATQTLNAVQEFEIAGNELVFTGFAVSKDKTAYNRISKDVKNMDTFNGKTAVLDNNKLTIINNEENFDSHKKSNFTNYKLSQIKNDSYTPKTLALGESNILFGYPNNKLSLFNFATGEIVNLDYVASGESLQDVYYSQNKYYVLRTDGDGARVCSFNEDGSNKQEVTFLESRFATNIAVDTLNNVFLTDDDKVYMNNNTTALCNKQFTEFDVDLCGNIFAINNDSIVYYDTTASTWQTAYTHTSAIKNFTMNYDRDEIYFTTNGSELLYQVKLPVTKSNLAISSIATPTNLNTHSLIEADEFKVYTIKENNFVCLINANSYLDFSGATTDKEFVFLTDVEVDTVNGKRSFSLLAGLNGIVLTHKNNLVEKQVQMSTVNSKMVYVATPVRAYSLPLITKTNDYVLTNNSGLVSLETGKTLTVTKSFKYLDKEFYYATVNDSNNAYNCYVPVNFTVDVLAEKVETTTYSFATVNECKLYEDALLTKEIQTIESGATVKVYSNDGVVCLVSVTINGNEITGYISANDIIDEPNTAVRNILVVLAVVACVCGSATFFLLRKKNN